MLALFMCLFLFPDRGIFRYFKSQIQIEERAKMKKLQSVVIASNNSQTETVANHNSVSAHQVNMPQAPMSHVQVVDANHSQTALNMPQAPIADVTVVDANHSSFDGLINSQTAQEMPQVMPQAPMSRLEELEWLREHPLQVGKVVRVVWRVAETLTAEPSEWFVSVLSVTGITQEGGRTRYATSFAWEGEQLEGTLPLRIDFELAAIDVVKQKCSPSMVRAMFTATIHTTPMVPMVSHTPPMVLHHEAESAKEGTAKRQRSPEPPVADATALWAAAADVSRGRASVAVSGGDGLRVPANIPLLWAGCYPHLWSNVRPEEWRDSLSVLQSHLGVLARNPLKREEIKRATDNITNMSCWARPVSKWDWQSQFDNVLMVIVVWLQVLHGRDAGDMLQSKWKTAWAVGYLDIEDLVRQVETTSVSGARQGQSDETKHRHHNDKDLLAQVRVLSAQVSQQQAGRGGRGRGGRGNFRGRGH